MTDLTDKSAGLIDWNLNKAGKSIYPSTIGAPAKGLTQVTLEIIRYGRRYSFNYVFSGIGMKY